MTQLAKLLLALLAAWALASSAAAQETAREVSVGYQLIYNPWKVAIASGRFEQATGYRIHWVKFESGAQVMNAIAAGDVEVALAGSSPIAAAVSLGIDLKLFWIAEDIADAEALVVRDGAGIGTPADLKGKRLGVPFVSTTHFHTIFALEHFGIDPKEVRLINLQPDQIATAWERGEIDAAFVWNPARARILETGKVLITSGQLSALGKATFDGMVADRGFAEAHPEFMTAFVRIMAEADAAYRGSPQDWTADSENVRRIVELVGGDPEDVPAALALYRFPTLKEQASCRWLGCGSDGGAARALRFTAEFLKSQRKIPDLAPDYGRFVTSEYVESVLAMQ